MSKQSKERRGFTYIRTLMWDILAWQLLTRKVKETLASHSCTNPFSARKGEVI